MPGQESDLVRKLRQELRSAKGELAIESALWPSDQGGARHGGRPKARHMHVREHTEDIMGDDFRLRAMIRQDRDRFEYICDRFDAAVSRMGDGAPLFEDDEYADPGNRCKLRRRVMVFMSLTRLAHNMAQEVLAAMFGVDQSTVSRCLQFALPVIEKVLPTHKVVAAAVRAAATEAELRRILPGMEGIVDGTHVRVQRPPDAAGRKEAYSGKKKAFTASVSVMTNIKGLVIYASKPLPGSTHDLTAILENPPDLGRWLKKMTDPRTPERERIAVRADLGYVGLEKHWPGAAVVRPDKTPKGGRLTQAQACGNMEASAKRICVEHAIGRIKAYEIMRGPYDADLAQFELEFSTVTGLVNLGLVWGGRRKRPDLEA